MVSLSTIISAVAVLATAASAMPASVRLSARQLEYYKIGVRQNELAKPQNLTDVQGLNYALALERLENAFYNKALNETGSKMTKETRATLEKVRDSEETHITVLAAAVSKAGAKPVETCEYNFNTSDVTTVVKTAGVLENIGVSAYLAALAGINDKAVLGTAAAIATVESRHQTSIRGLDGQQPVPAPFDTPLSPRAVATLAKPFIASCPEGSGLPVEPFPALAMMAGQDADAMKAGSLVKLQVEESGGSAGKMCAFTTTPDKSAGGALFAPFSEQEGCAIPEGLAGITYVFLTSSAPADSAVTDEITVAGPMVMVMT